MIKYYILCLFICVLTYSSVCFAPEEEEIEDLSPDLIGGRVADPADWPASPWIGNCSSTLIGKRVLLTAAHCVSNGSSVNFTLNSNRYTGKCSHHSQFRSNSTADWALCLLSTDVRGVEFESIASAKEVGCHTGQVFTWTGYGCTRWGGGIDGRFRVGDVSAIRCPVGSNYDTVTRGSVALCSGDSGGGGYLKVNGKRKVVGVNSRSNTTDTSYVSSTYSEAFRSFAVSWSKSNNVKICGIDQGAQNCGEGPGPNPSPSPSPSPSPQPGCEFEADQLRLAKLLVKDAEKALEECMSDH